jgi:hypothetical protein
MQFLRGIAMPRRVMQAQYFAHASNPARRRMRERVREHGLPPERLAFLDSLA